MSSVGLSAARTRMGEDTLAGWLLAAAPAAELQDRQSAVLELQFGNSALDRFHFYHFSNDGRIGPRGRVGWTPAGMIFR